MNQSKELENLMAQSNINGVVLLKQAGCSAVMAARGWADRNLQKPLHVDSVFELASLAKPITAVAVIQLAEKGVLNLEDDLSKWLPNFPYAHIQIIHLLQHTSGLPEYMQLLAEHAAEWKGTISNHTVLDLLIQNKPDIYFEPGESWAYTNTNYVLLALLVEKATGRSFADYLQEAIFQPLGMEHSFVATAPPAENMAEPHAYDPIKQQYVSPADLPEYSYVTYMKAVQGDGSILSNAEDLMAFMEGWQSGKLAGLDTVREAETPVDLGMEGSIGYGYGWLVADTDKGMRVGHTGGWPGSSTCLYHYPEHGKTLICLLNEESEQEFEKEFTEAAIHILFEENYQLPKHPKQRKVHALDLKTMENLSGSYLFPDGLTAALVIENGLLYFKVSGQMTAAVYAISATEWVIHNTGITLTADPDKLLNEGIGFQQEEETLFLEKTAE